jgi:hypothetical protein
MIFLLLIAVLAAVPAISLLAFVASMILDLVCAVIGAVILAVKTPRTAIPLIVGFVASVAIVIGLWR